MQDLVTAVCSYENLCLYLLTVTIPWCEAHQCVCSKSLILFILVKDLLLIILTQFIMSIYDLLV